MAAVDIVAKLLAAVVAEYEQFYKGEGVDDASLLKAKQQ